VQSVAKKLEKSDTWVWIRFKRLWHQVAMWGGCTGGGGGKGGRGGEVEGEKKRDRRNIEGGKEIKT